MKPETIAAALKQATDAQLRSEMGSRTQALRKTKSGGRNGGWPKGKPRKPSSELAKAASELAKNPSERAKKLLLGSWEAGPESSGFEEIPY